MYVKHGGKIMKRIIATLFVLMLIMPVVLAQQQGIHEPGTGIEQPELKEAQQMVNAQSTTQLQEMVQEKQQEMNQNLEGLGTQQREMIQNQNRVRLAVHALIGAEDLIGGSGPQVSGLARECNNSVQATIRAEEKIQNRGALTRLFAGGDAEAAKSLQGEVNQNQQRIQEMQQLIQDCTCDEPVREMLQEQLQSMEQEQLRLQELAESELQSKGLFGWIWK